MCVDFGIIKGNAHIVELMEDGMSDTLKTYFDDLKCGICGKNGTNIILTNHSLHANNAYHEQCLDGKTDKCGGCNVEFPLRELITSYWHCGAWRCIECEREMK